MEAVNEIKEGGPSGQTLDLSKAWMFTTIT